MESILRNPEVGAVIVFIIGAVLRAVFKERAANAESVFESGVEIAYNMVNDVAKRSANKIDDKVAMALGILKDHYALHGKKLDAVGEARAKMLFSAMHGAEQK